MLGSWAKILSLGGASSLVILLLYAAQTSPSFLQILPPEGCRMHGQPYNCSLLFDWQFYVRTNADAKHLTPAAAFHHWKTVGVQQGRRCHQGRRVLKIVLMSKDDWPMLRSNVLYHADIYGGNNVYVLDSSTNPDAIAFLELARQALQVNVIFTRANLNQVLEELNSLMKALMWSADYLIKLDTDEFLALDVGENVPPGIASKQIHDYLDEMPMDGTRYRTGYWVWSIPTEKCNTSDDPVVTQTVFDFTPVLGMKAFFAAWAFKFVDLGSHINKVRKPFNNTALTPTRLVLVHYHWQCYDKFVEVTRRAVFSHKYFSPDSSAKEQLAACRGKWKGFQGNSWHKVADYCAHLENPDASRAAYLQAHVVPGAGKPTWEGLAHRVQELSARFH